MNSTTFQLSLLVLLLLEAVGTFATRAKSAPSKTVTGFPQNLGNSVLNKLVEATLQEGSIFHKAPLKEKASAQQPYDFVASAIFQAKAAASLAAAYELLNKSGQTELARLLHVKVIQALVPLASEEPKFGAMAELSKITRAQSIAIIRLLAVAILKVQLVETRLDLVDALLMLTAVLIEAEDQVTRAAVIDFILSVPDGTRQVWSSGLGLDFDFGVAKTTTPEQVLEEAHRLLPLMRQSLKLHDAALILRDDSRRQMTCILDQGSIAFQSLGPVYLWTACELEQPLPSLETMQWRVRSLLSVTYGLRPPPTSQASHPASYKAAPTKIQKKAGSSRDSDSKQREKDAKSQTSWARHLELDWSPFMEFLFG
jgi:hypothetical protein